MTDTLNIRCEQCNTKIDVGQYEPFSKVPCPSCDHTIVVPKSVNGFLLISELSQGSSQSSYSACHPSEDKPLVVRHLDSLSGIDASSLEKLTNRLSKTPGHENVKSATDAFAHEGEVYLYRRHRENSIRQHLTESGVFDIENSNAIILLTLETLKEALAAGMQISVLQTNNLFFKEDGTMTITDGNTPETLYKIAGRPLDALGSFFNLRYAGPSFLKHGEFSVTSLVYSIFVTYYECLTGTVPFQATDRSGALKERESEITFPDNIVVPRALKQLILDILNGKEAPMESINEAADTINAAINAGDEIIEKKATTTPSTPVATAKKITAPKKSTAPQARSGKKMSVDKNRIKNIKKKKSSSVAIPFLLMVTVFCGAGYYYRADIEKMYDDYLEKKNRKVVAKPTVDDRPVYKARVISTVKEKVNPNKDNEIKVNRITPEEAAEILAEFKSVDNYNFDGMDDKLRRYLSQFTPEVYDIERIRFHTLKNLRRSFKIYNEESNYTGQFSLNDTEPFYGTITNIEDDLLKIETIAKKEKVVRDIAWKDIPPVQLASMITFYVSQQYKDTTDVLSLSDDDYNRTGVLLYNLSIYMDWYGQQELAQKYKLMAIKNKPSVEKKINALISAPKEETPKEDTLATSPEEDTAL